jgi:Flp pilus assembly pilin Flp
MWCLEEGLVQLQAWIWVITDRLAQRRAQRGLAQSTVEYALVGALVVIAAAGALTILGSQVNTVFGNISNTLRTAASSGGGH